MGEIIPELSAFFSKFARKYFKDCKYSVVGSIFAKKERGKTMKYTRYSITTDVIARGNNDKQYVRFRVTCLSKRIDLYTGIVVSKKDWSDKTHRIKQGKYVNGTPFNVINTDIDNKEGFIVNYFNQCAFRDALPQLKELKEQFNHSFRYSPEQRSSEFFYLFDKFVESTSETRGWTGDMAQKFNRLRNRLYKYNPKLSFLDLSETMMNSIVKELSLTMCNDALTKTLSYFKRFVKWAESKHYPINNEFFSFNPKLPKVHKAVRYLTPEELGKIADLPLEEGGALDMTRDFFLFQCNTALRYSDLKQLKKDNIIIQPDGKYALRKLTEKDDDVIYIPLTNTATNIYMKYRDNVYVDDALFPIISNQKYNEHLKELGEKAELKGMWTDYEYRLNERIEIKTPKKDLSSHTARRTFVVTAYNAGVPLDLIAMVTSHCDMKAMQPYLKATPKGSQMAVDAFEQATASRT